MNVNLTLSIDESVLLEARKLALERRTTVNQMVRDYLAAIVEADSGRAAARQRLKALGATGVVEVGPRTWSRDDLHERSR